MKSYGLRGARKAVICWALVGIAGLASCGGGGASPTPPNSGATFAIGGTLSGLTGGTTGASVTLHNNGADALVLSANGAFVFATPLPAGSIYDVTVVAQPKVPAQVCTVSRGRASVPSANVSDVEVQCMPDTGPQIALSYVKSTEPGVGNVFDKLHVEITGSYDPVAMPIFEVRADGKRFACCSFNGSGGRMDISLGAQFTPYTTTGYAFVAQLMDKDRNVVATSNTVVSPNAAMPNLLAGGDGVAATSGVWTVVSGLPKSVQYGIGSALPFNQCGNFVDACADPFYFAIDPTVPSTVTTELKQTVTLAFPGRIGSNGPNIYIGGLFGKTATLEYTFRGENLDGSTFVSATGTLRNQSSSSTGMSKEFSFGQVPEGTQFLDVRLLLRSGAGGYADNLFVTVLPN